MVDIPVIDQRDKVLKLTFRIVPDTEKTNIFYSVYCVKTKILMGKKSFR
jgi:hypothetical protein